jgi:hypothetical protein
MDPTSGRDNDTAKSPSLPDVISKSMNTPQSKTKMADSGSRQVTTGPTSQGRLSYAAIARKAASNERPDGAAGASPGAASSQPSRTRKTRPVDNQSTAVPAVVSRDRQATVQRGDISRFGVEVDAQSRASQVSPRVAIVLPLIIFLCYSLLTQTTLKKFEPHDMRVSQVLAPSHRRKHRQVSCNGLRSRAPEPFLPHLRKCSLLRDCETLAISPWGFRDQENGGKRTNCRFTRWAHPVKEIQLDPTHCE